MGFNSGFKGLKHMCLQGLCYPDERIQLYIGRW